MVRIEEIKHNVLTPSEYDIIYQGDYLPYEIMYNVYHSENEFKKDFFKYNKGKTALRAVYCLVWASDFVHFNEDAVCDYIYIKEATH